MKEMIFAARLLCVLAILTIVAVPLTVFAASGVMAPTPTTDLAALIAQFLALGGVAAFFAMLINAGKQFGWLPDGYADVVTVGFDLFGLVALWLLDVFRPELVTRIDNIAGILAQIGVYLISLIGAILVSKVTHLAIRGFPVIGFSFSRQMRRARRVVRARLSLPCGARPALTKRGASLFMELESGRERIGGTRHRAMT